MAGTRWTPEEVEALVAYCRTHGRDFKGYAALSGRSIYSVRERIDRGDNGARQAIEEYNAEQRAAKIAAAPAAIDPTNAEILRLEREIAAARDLLRAKDAKIKAQHRDTSVFEQLAAVIRSETAPLPAMPAAAFQRTRDAAAKAATPCSFVQLLYDQHADSLYEREATWGLESFSFDIFRIRLQRLRDLVRDYATIHLPRHRPEQLVILSGGDAVNGDVHGMGPRNTFANTIKAAIATGDAQAQMIQTLLPHFPLGVHVVGVSGNHPRRSERKDYTQLGPHDNFDYLVGVQMATRLAREIDAGRCSVTLPNAWSAFVRVRETLIAMNHGDEVNAMVGLPFVGFDRRNGRVQSMLSRVGERADIFVYGHWHTPGAFASAGGMSYHSGCFAAADPYALNKLAVGGEPQQTLLVIGDKRGPRGVLLPIPIFLRDEVREDAFRAGNFVPELGQATALDVVNPSPSEGLHIIEAA